MRALKLIIACTLLAATAACAPHPIVARDPVPAPSPDEAYVCDSTSLVLNAFHTRCEPQVREQRPVLQSKG